MSRTGVRQGGLVSMYDSTARLSLQSKGSATGAMAQGVKSLCSMFEDMSSDPFK